MIERYISHKQDIHDLVIELQDKVLPLKAIIMKAVPEKTHEAEYEKRRRQMSYFHRSICTAYADAAGVDEQTAKYELMTKFGRCGEVTEDESGEFDIAWLEGDKLRVMEQNKKYYVMSVAAMANDELARLIDQCKNYILQYYGVMVSEFSKNYKTKS